MIFFFTVLVTSLGPSPQSSIQYQQSFPCCTVCLVWLALGTREIPYDCLGLVFHSTCLFDGWVYMLQCPCVCCPHSPQKRVFAIPWILNRVWAWPKRTYGQSCVGFRTSITVWLWYLTDPVQPGLFYKHLCNWLINEVTDPFWKYLQNTFIPKP